MVKKEVKSKKETVIKEPSKKDGLIAMLEASINGFYRISTDDIQDILNYYHLFFL